MKTDLIVIVTSLDITKDTPSTTPSLRIQAFSIITLSNLAGNVNGVFPDLSFYTSCTAAVTLILFQFHHGHAAFSLTVAAQAEDS